MQRPKGRKWEKAKEKRAKSTKDAWAEIMANKQLACGKRVEEKEAKKEERHQAFMEIQRQKVALEQKKVDTDAENAATARLSEDSKIMFADTSLMDENQ